MTLAAVIIAKNEELNIRDCLESVKFADEIIVIDDCSADDTPDIARSLNARVYTRAMEGDYAAQYNFALSQVTAKWVLIIDADERVTEELGREISRVVASDERYGYEITNINIIMGQVIKHGDWHGKPQLRLFPSGAVRLEGLVHSRYVHTLPLRELDGRCMHYPYPTWEKYFDKFNRYTLLSAEESFRKGKKAGFLGDILIRPLFAFFKMYILKSGWRDGKIGFILAFYHYFYTMTKYVKLYYIEKGRGGD